MENELSAHKRTISTISLQKDEHEKFFKTRKDKESEKVINLEKQVKDLNDIVYKTGQSIQTMNMLNRNCKTSFVKPEYLKKAQSANPRLYDIGCYNDNLALMLAPDSNETIRLAQENLKAQLQDKNIAINELKKLIDKMKGKSMETMFEKPSVIRLPNAFKCQKQSILVQKKTNVIAQGMYKVHIRPNQTRTTQLPQEIRKTNKCMSFSTRVIPTTSVSRPPLKSTQLKDRVLHYNSQGKKHEVEDHRRIFKFSNNKTSITACNDSLNVKTSNVNFVCVTYGKCVLNDNHDFCILHYINGMNSRTKKLIVVPISTREPKRTMNQSVATPHKKIVASEPTIKKPRSTFRKLYEHLVEIILFIVDSGCSKHMTGNLKLLRNFVEKFLGTVKFGNDQFALILGYGDLVQGNITIKKVYYVEGLNHNLFSVGQFRNADLEVVFQKSTCYVRDLKENDVLTGSHGTNLYSITL
ncbi:hypothetical protein Tco_0673894 [Tanacetum coccineum]